MTVLHVPRIARRRAQELGADGVTWLDSLDESVSALAAQWSFTVQEPVPGATASVVLAVRLADGADAVLKLEVPEPSTAGQGAVLERAAGRGYARLLARDPVRRALLLERLGAPLGRRRLPAEQELAVLADLASTAWLEPEDETGSSAEKAAALAAFVDETAPGVAVPPDVVGTALRFAERRAAAAVREMVVHGDPHPGNALEVPVRRRGDVHGYVWVDPDGFVADPAYDLGVVLRERGTAKPLPASTVRGFCALLAERTGRDAEAIWEWGYLERVSTGLLLLRLGEEERGDRWLASAAGLLP